MSARMAAVHHPVTDVGAAVAFYGAALGLPVRFQDGLRYAALGSPSAAALALVNPSENVVLDHPAAAFRADNLDVTLAAIVRAGGAIAHPAAEGPHEVRAVARDPWGNAFIIYASTPAGH